MVNVCVHTCIVSHLYLQCVIAQIYVLLLLHLWVHIISGAVILGPPVELNCLLIIWIKLLKEMYEHVRSSIAKNMICKL